MGSDATDMTLAHDVHAKSRDRSRDLSRSIDPKKSVNPLVVL